MNDKSAIRYLSLAAKAGRLVTGVEDCEKALKKRRGDALLILAADAAPNAQKRAEALSEAGAARLVKTEFTKSELAAAVGRGSSVALALVTDWGLAEAFRAAANPKRQEERI